MIGDKNNKAVKKIDKIKNGVRPPLHITGLFTLRRPLGGSGSVLARSFASIIPTPKLRHILPALVFASQSPYPGWQNVVNSRNVMCNTKPNFFGKIIKNEFALDKIDKMTVF
jgi:hypothetical protein